MEIRLVAVQDQILKLQLESKFWESIDEIIESRGTTLAKLVSQLDNMRPDEVASDLRILVLRHYQRRAKFSW